MLAMLSLRRGEHSLRLLPLLCEEAEIVKLPDLAFPVTVSKSRKSGSERLGTLELSAGRGGLEAGETRGDVCMASGIVSLVSNTKNASPPSPSFIA
jgi:hypothetical protein